MPQVISYKSPKMGPIVIDYHVNSIGREFNWTRKHCPQMRTVGYKVFIIIYDFMTYEFQNIIHDVSISIVLIHDTVHSKVEEIE